MCDIIMTRVWENNYTFYHCPYILSVVLARYKGYYM